MSQDLRGMIADNQAAREQVTPEKPPDLTAAEYSAPVVKPKKSFGAFWAKCWITAARAICNSPSPISATPAAIFAGSRWTNSTRAAAVRVSLQEARDVIDIAVKNHIGYLLFVGGEPLVHKDLRAMVRYAAERGIRPMICTNGSLWTEQNMRGFADDGLSSVIMSIDSHDVARHEKNRGLPEVCRKIKRANEVFAGLGVQTTASVTVSRLIDDYDKLPEFLRTLGFSSCTFSYPLTSLASSYLSFSDSSLVSYTTEELIGVFEKIKAMKTAQRLSRWSTRRNRSRKCSGICARSRSGSAAWAATSIFIWIGTSTSTAATPGTSRCATFTTSTKRS